MLNNSIGKSVRVHAAWAHGRNTAITIGMLFAVALGFAAALWLAGFVYFALGHQNPLRAGWWGWFDGVSAYLDGRLPKECRHLLGSAVLALTTVFGGPLLGWAAIQDQRTRRELHGSARFATERDVRKAGLL